MHPKYLLASFGSALWLGLGGYIPAIAAPQTAPIPINQRPEDSVTQQLLGRWQSEIPNKSPYEKPPIVPIDLLFAPNGKLYVILRSTRSATELQYQVVNTRIKPHHLDVSWKRDVAKTIFELMPNGQLRLEIAGDRVGTNKPRPTSFHQDTAVFRKVSNDSTLPPNIKLTDPSDHVNRAPQAIASSRISTLTKAQQAFYIEYQRFATTIEELGVGLNPNTEDYSYKLVVIDAKKLVQVVAVSKRGDLRSFVGITQVSSRNAGDFIPQAILCRSNQPTQDMPPQPKVTGKAITCPAGYSPY